MTVNTYVSVYLGSVSLALVVTPAVIWLARRIGALDQPNARSVHGQPIPRIGGVAIFVSSMCLILPVLFLRNDIGEAFREVRLQVIALLGSATFIFLLGLVDDLWHLPAGFKFLAELAAAGILCLAGVRIDEIGLVDGYQVSLGWLGCPLTLLWVAGITNAVNLSDGLDGLAAGISAITCGVIAALAINSDNPMMAVFALSLVGSLSGFLFFNFNPARVFMGDCGSLFLGYTIAASSVMCMTKSSAVVGLTLPALALGIPIFDTLFSMLRRYLERRSLFAPDRRHFHHRLLEMGLHQRQAVLIIYVLTLLFSSLGLLTVVMHDLDALIVFGGIFLLLLVTFRIVGAVHLRETLASLQERYRLARQQRAQQATFEQAQLQIQQAHDTSQWWQAVCEVAGQMGFASVALTRTGGDGRAQTDFWEAPATRATIPRVLRMTVPCGSAREEPAQEFEIAICIDESLEDACRRASLFSRLIDTQGAIRGTDRAELVAAGAPVGKAGQNQHPRQPSPQSQGEPRFLEIYP
jgi:UDP-GlcNAc:undecaprenyl-phosphate GlcNAc-1-phosphate transferase